MTPARVVAACGLAAAVAACAGRPAADPLAVRQFAAVAFSAEMGGAGREGHLVKWTRAPAVAVTGLDAERYRPRVRQRLRRLKAVTGLDLRLAPPGGRDARLRVLFLPPAAVRAASGAPAPCYVTVDSRAGVIRRATVRIAPRSPALVGHCLAEELTQAMGLLDDSPLDRTAIFYEGSRRTTLSRRDRLMLRLLYHPALKPGMTRARAMPVVRRLVAEGVQRRDVVAGGFPGRP